MDKVAIEIAHWSAVLPVLFLLALAPSRKLGPARWLIGFAFAVSFFADTIREVTGVPFIAQPYYPALQFALFALALSVGRPWLSDVISMVAVFAVAASAMLLAGPDVWVRVVGSIVMLALARDHEMAWPLFVYCGLATAFYLRMLWEGADIDAARPWWYAYQGCRLASFWLFGRAAWRTATA